MPLSQDADVSLHKQTFTLQDKQNLFRFSIERGLVWEAWEHEGVNLFETLGLMIGPHAGSRRFVKDDPFVNGIATSVSWECTYSSENQLKFQLQGTKKDNEETTLANLEGQAFTLQAIISLTPNGILFNLSVCAESDGLIGMICPTLHNQKHVEYIKESSTTGHFSINAAKALKGRIIALNPEWSCFKDNEKLIIYSALYPEKPILTINQVDVTFQIEP